MPGRIRRNRRRTDRKYPSVPGKKLARVTLRRGKGGREGGK